MNLTQRDSETEGAKRSETPLTDLACGFDRYSNPSMAMERLEKSYNEAIGLLDRVHHQLQQGERVYPNSFLAEDIAKYLSKS